MSDKMDVRNLDIHSDQDFRDLLKLSGGPITCSWFVAAIRHHDDGKWVPILMFADEDKKEFAHAFELRCGGAEIAALVARLQAVQRTCDQRNE